MKMFSSAETQLLHLAADARLFDDDYLTAELAHLVPHLHPVDALTRFGGLRDSVEALVKVDARCHAKDVALQKASARAVSYHEGLVEQRLQQMFTPTVAFNDDGSPWTAPAPVVQAVAA